MRERGGGEQGQKQNNAENFMVHSEGLRCCVFRMGVLAPVAGLSGQMKRAKLRNPSAADMEKMKEGRRVAALCPTAGNE